MKKLLVLGISHSQLDLINVAHDMGYYVIGVAGNDKGVAKDVVDKFIEADITDVEVIDKIVKDEEVDAIYTMALEMTIPVISEVSLKNGLRTFVPDKKSLEMFEDKYAWRQALGDIPGNVKSIKAEKLEELEDWNIYPAVIKPVDGSGQRGVHKVESFEEIEEVFERAKSFSKSGNVILEEFIGGEEISVNSFMYNGKLAFYIMSDRISYTEYPGGIIKEHHIPSKYDNEEINPKVKALVESVNKTMKYDNGHVYFQLKVQNNEPKMVEFTPRYDACHMWKLVSYACDINLAKASLEYLMEGKSEEIENYEFHLNDGIYKTYFISDKPGTIVNKDNYEVPENPLYLYWYYDNGDKVKTVTGYMEKVGFYIVKE